MFSEREKKGTDNTNYFEVEVGAFKPTRTQIQQYQFLYTEMYDYYSNFVTL